MSHLPQNDDVFFREVDEDYRREQTIKFFKDYGAYFVAGAFLILVAVSAYTFQKDRTAKQAAEGGDALVSALSLSEAGKTEDAQKILDTLAKKGPGTYQTIARLQAAGELAAKDSRDAALAGYKAVAADETAPEALRTFARLQAASLSLGTESYEALSRSLDALRSGTSRWRFSAKEILGLSAFKEGKVADAERLFRELATDGEAPQGTRQRAEVMLTLLLEGTKPAPADPTGKKDNDAKTQ